MDGNSLSKWNAANTDAPQTLTIDLGRKYKINRCETFMEYADKAVQYIIEYSTDNKTWKSFKDQRGNTAVHNPCYVDEGQAKARWVRITIHPSGEKKGNAVHEFRVFGK